MPGIDPSAFRMRPPVDLGNKRLRTLAAALGPSYMRVSGTWANSTYFHDSDTTPPAAPPAGFGGVLTRDEWRGVIEFSKAVDAKIVTSFAISPGVRDAEGIWTPREAEKLIAFTKANGGSIAAAEFFNEPTMAAMGGAPKGYDAAAYGRDFQRFLPFIRETMPGIVVLGPGGLGEGGGLAGGGMQVMGSEALLRAAGPGLDGFSYHFYGAVSQRCGMLGAKMQTTSGEALSEDWLAKTSHDEAYYAALRDRMAPGKPMWLTETGEAACGGNPWAASFIDSFRYLDQLGRLAKAGVQVVAHNTLAASDYGLIDETTLTPRPNYWAALLWHKLMDRRVLDAGVSPVAAVHLYAHCLRGHSGGVALLAINADAERAHELGIAKGAERYSLTSTSNMLLDASVSLNGKTLALNAQDELPALDGERVRETAAELAPASITFLAFPKAGNAACR